MSGELPRLGASYVGRLMKASDFNTIAAREAYFPAGGADTWWMDDALVSSGYTGGVQVDVAAGDLPNRVYFAPFDWPAAGVLLRRPRVVRVLLMEGSVNSFVTYPGDPGLATVNNTIPAALLGVVAPALAAAATAAGVLFALHQAWQVNNVGGFGESRFLRALAPTVLAPGESLATDVLNLVFLFESGSVGALIGGGPDFETVYLPWNYAFAGLSDYNDIDGDGVHAGLNANFDADAALVAAAYPGFPRYRTVLFDCDPGPQDVEPGGANDVLIADLALTASNNVAQLTEMAAALVDSGFEYGGSFDPLTDDGAAIVAIALAHFGP